MVRPTRSTLCQLFLHRFEEYYNYSAVVQDVGEVHSAFFSYRGCRYDQFKDDLVDNGFAGGGDNMFMMVVVILVRLMRLIRSMRLMRLVRLMRLMRLVRLHTIG